MHMWSFYDKYLCYMQEIGWKGYCYFHNTNGGKYDKFHLHFSTK